MNVVFLGLNWPHLQLLWHYAKPKGDRPQVSIHAGRRIEQPAFCEKTEPDIEYATGDGNGTRPCWRTGSPRWRISEAGRGSIRAILGEARKVVEMFEPIVAEWDGEGQ